jgi:hypothetical protein
MMFKPDVVVTDSKVALVRWALRRYDETKNERWRGVLDLLGVDHESLLGPIDDKETGPVQNEVHLLEDEP